MAIHVRRRKEARLLHQKVAPWGTDTRWVMVVVVMVMVGYHDTQQIEDEGEKERAHDRGGKNSLWRHSLEG